jgi:cobalt/nickel transport system permease protein
MLFHIGTVHLANPKMQSFWQSLAPQTRILVVFILVVAIALPPNGQWLTWGLYGIAIVGIVGISQVKLSLLLKRMLIESIFIGVVLLGTLFRQGGDTVWQWGWFTVTTTGLTILASVTFKAVLSLLVLNTLTLSTPTPDLLRGLAALRTPPLLVAILGSMNRYLMILVAEFQAMRRAAISRNLLRSPQQQRMVVGNIFGSLFIRTYERGERVHQAMLARGYQGLPPTMEKPVIIQKRDRIALFSTVFIALLGQSMMLF